MPNIDVLLPRKTDHHPLGPIPHDESSNAGNLAVLESIFLGQYKLKDEAFIDALLLIFGDQKTVQRIRTCKRRRRGAALPYNSLKWALPIPAFFHLKMNLLYMISTCHFGGQGSEQSTLHYAMNLWARKKISAKKSEFFALEELIIHSFQARIVGFLWRKLSGTGLGRTAKDISSVLRTLPPQRFLNIINNIQDEYANTTNLDIDSICDGEARNHILFLRHAQTYMLLKYGIKHGDIGLIRRAIDRCCVYFHGSSQHKYAYEMLYLQRLFKASKPCLTRAILSNSLVNLRGCPDTWFETDRLVELHNGNMKKLFTAKRGSSIHLEYLFKNYSLNSAHLAELGNQIDRVFGARSNSEHTLKDARKDILVMAEMLYPSSLARISGRTVNHKAIDALAIGALRLSGDVLAKFNASQCFDEPGPVESLIEHDREDTEVQEYFEQDHEE